MNGNPNAEFLLSVFVRKEFRVEITSFSTEGPALIPWEFLELGQTIVHEFEINDDRD